ncbi:MAG: hypothetical protein HC824_20865 [Synechococcales cyanobacterium RM1_1_8]|nr:hypothetical protein [Synechococcales cyanobacterium RM1_1_8]
MICPRLAPAWFAAVAPLPLIVGLVTAAAQATTLPTQSCAYDPASGKPNPLGDRAAITISEINGSTTFTYQEIPTRSDRGPSVVVVAPKREITLENTGLEAARQILLENPAYYNDLIGYPSASGFATVNASLTCWSNDLDNEAPPQATLPPRQVPATTAPIAPREIPDNPVVEPAPAAGSSGAVPQVPSTAIAPSAAAPTPVNLATLPDGSYRFWNGDAKGQTMTDAALLEGGGALFIFRKANNFITGNFAYIDSEDAYCVYGQGNNSTVSGFVYPYGPEVLDLGESFRNLGPTDFLRVRRTRIANNRPFYSSALLDLSTFQPINLGPVAPPTSC